MEEGEVAPAEHTQLDYDPAFEWPGDFGDTDDSTIMNEELSSKIYPWHPLRLSVVQSSILPRHKHKLAVVDAYDEVQFGRDVAPSGSQKPRIRLKEMEVSKLHATVYWDRSRREWAIVDMGSKHGTFLKSDGGSSMGTSTSHGVRLSPPRVASLPRPLRHGNHITIGSTTFAVHIHQERIPCSSCLSQDVGDIPLFNVLTKNKEKSITKRPREVAAVGEPEARDAKKALTALKQNLLMRHTQQYDSLQSTNTNYLDRSARRRSLYSSSHPDPPGVPIPRIQASRSAPSGFSTPEATPPPSRPNPSQSQAPTPLSEANIGHRLLMKQGWQPGEVLGVSRGSDDDDQVRLAEPLEVSSTTHRAGLGMRQQPATSAAPFDQWKENSRQRRWDTVRLNGV